MLNRGWLLWLAAQWHNHAGCQPPRRGQRCTDAHSAGAARWCGRRLSTCAARRSRSWSCCCRTSNCIAPSSTTTDVAAIAKEASARPQNLTAVDTRTAHRAVARLARARTTAAWPTGWYRSLMDSRHPPPVPGGDRASAVDVHQLRAEHWTSSAQWRHRVGQNPARSCAQCTDPTCQRPAAWCAGRRPTRPVTFSCAAQR